MTDVTRISEPDHNLLIRLDQKVSDLQGQMSRQITEVKDAITNIKDDSLRRIQNLEVEKADRTEVEKLQKKVNDDVEKRVMVLENKTAKYFITISIYSAIGAIIIALIVYHILQ